MMPNQISDLIRSRRSVFPKNYTDEKVDNSIINEMLENANWAPTHRLTEPWRFVVFEGEGLKKLAEFQSARYKMRSEAEGNYNPDKFSRLASKPLACSHILAICMKRDQRESVPEIEEISAVSCSVQNILLTAAAYGLGCYWSTGGTTYDLEARDFFGLNENDRLMGFVMVGVPDKQPKEGRRGPIDEKVRWVR